MNWDKIEKYKANYQFNQNKFHPRHHLPSPSVFNYIHSRLIRYIYSEFVVPSSQNVLLGTNRSAEYDGVYFESDACPAPVLVSVVYLLYDY